MEEQLKVWLAEGREREKWLIGSNALSVASVLYNPFSVVTPCQAFS